MKFYKLEVIEDNKSIAKLCFNEQEWKNKVMIDFMLDEAFKNKEK